MNICSRCGKPLNANNKSGIHGKCMTAKERFARIDANTKRTGTEERGNADDWRHIAKQANIQLLDEDLDAMGFKNVPTLPELRTRYKELMLQTHPDLGGSNERAAVIISAYESILARIKKVIK
jgi:hypothetical protein